MERSDEQDGATTQSLYFNLFIYSEATQGHISAMPKS
jgi:hypothetical protein